jgi:electron transfer flavoprotein alpha subunit
VSLLAIVVIRDGVLPAGADECIAEANGSVVLIGTGLDSIDSIGTAVTKAETETVRAPSLALALGDLDVVTAAHGLILPASPDGRDLAPLLSATLRRPLHAGATAVHAGRVIRVRTNGRTGREHATPEPFVATLIPGVRGTNGPAAATADTVTVRIATEHVSSSITEVAVLPPDPATMDLAEAPCIVGGGLGLGAKERFDQLGRIGVAIGASLGGTRVASDAGWIPFDRQIGTTGVAVKPTIYLAFGISGATQHTSGLGDPDHVISVNLDASCPMMAMSDVAIVSDANAVLDALESRLAR